MKVKLHRLYLVIKVIKLIKLILSLRSDVSKARHCVANQTSAFLHYQSK